MFSHSSRSARGLAAGAFLASAAACAAPAVSAEALVTAPRAPRAPDPAEPALPRESVQQGGRITDAERASGVLWRFDTGSAVPAAPAIGADGTVYVGTADGYVQALTPEGTLRWSYTVEAAVPWSPVVDPAGRVYVVTAAQHLYSFLPGGTLGWQIRTPAHVATEAVVAPPWGILFGDAASSVWAYSDHAVALWHVEIGGGITSAPAVRGSRIAVGTGSGDVWLLDGAAKRAVAHLGAPVRSTPGIDADGSAYVIAGGALHRLGAQGAVRWRRAGVEWATVTDGGCLVIDADRALVRLSADGAPLSHVPLGATASAAPVIAPSGAIYVSTDSGALITIRADGAVRQVAVARAPLKAPVLDVARQRVVVVAGAGTVTALHIES
jgi:outer membrane protein assembly factor BamB